MNSMNGSTGPTGSYGGTSTGSQLRGIDPRMKSISGHRKFQQFTPEQMNLFQQLFSHVQPDSYLSRLAGGDEGIFDQIEAPAMRQFNALQGSIASRFSGGNPFGGGGPGAMSARHGSGFKNYMNSAASNFAQDLQSQRQGLQRQALMDLMGISQSLFKQEPYGLVKKQPRQGGGWGGLIGGGIGAVGGGILGGPAGALQGAQMGYNVGNSFSGGGGGSNIGNQLSGLPNNWSDFVVNNLPGGVY